MYAKTSVIKTTFLLIFYLCLVLDKFPVFVNIRRRYCRTQWAKNWAPNSCSHVHHIL